MGIGLVDEWRREPSRPNLYEFLRTYTTIFSIQTKLRSPRIWAQLALSFSDLCPTCSHHQYSLRTNILARLTIDLAQYQSKFPNANAFPWPHKHSHTKHHPQHNRPSESHLEIKTSQLPLRRETRIQLFCREVCFANGSAGLKALSILFVALALATTKRITQH